MVEEAKSASLVPSALSYLYGNRDHLWLRFSNDQWSPVHSSMEQVSVLPSSSTAHSFLTKRSFWNFISCQGKARLECDRLSTWYHKCIVQSRRHSRCASRTMGGSESWSQVVNIHWQRLPVCGSSTSSFFSEQ